MKEFALKVCIAVLAVFAPAKAMILTSMVLITADLITGIIASKTQKIPITSAGLRRTISKLFVYELIILLAFLAQQNMTGPNIPVCNWVTSFIGLTELKSVLENLNIISGGSVLKAIIDKIGSDNK